jgi:hypothetical protein
MHLLLTVFWSMASAACQAAENRYTAGRYMLLCCRQLLAFFCVMKTTQSLPLTASEVMPHWRTALKAYSAYAASTCT